MTPVDRLPFDLRTAVRPDDPQAVRTLVAATGFFSPEEIDIAEELVEETLARGSAAGYEFLLAEDASGLVGYSCYGLIPGTEASYDLYWIAVRPNLQGRGLGRWLLQETERRVVAGGGRRAYVDTSGRPQYLPTRRFYEGSGYETAAILEDFYAPGDAKVIFQKKLA